MKISVKIAAKILCAASSMLFVFWGCIRDPLSKTGDKETVQTRAFTDNSFYYFGYENKKIFLTQSTDKVFLRFTSDTDRAKIGALIGDAASLKLIDEHTGKTNY